MSANQAAEVGKRIEGVLKTPRGAAERRETIQALRAIDVLELADTDEARRLLAALARGGEHDRQTREAKGALERLAKRPTDAP